MVFICFSVICQTSYSINIIGNPKRFGSLYIAQYDFPQLMNSKDAIKACESLGDGWRLPTIDELELINKNKDLAKIFQKKVYWSSTKIYPYFSNSGFIVYNFEEGYTFNVGMNNLNLVRAIKDNEALALYNKKLEEDKRKIIGKPLVLGVIEIAENDFPVTMGVEDAKKACESLGDGWRLPTLNELNILYRNKKKLTGLREQWYWSSKEGLNKGWFWYKDFGSGKQESWPYDTDSNIRAVRTIK